VLAVSLRSAQGAAFTPSLPGELNEDRMEFRIEKKYVLDLAQASLAKAIIDAHCLPDPHFPMATVHSIYYDTLDLQFLSEKIDSTYFKAKVRLRWYGDWNFNPDNGPSFLEAKLKEGGRQRKVRMQMPHTGSELAKMPLGAPALAALPAQLVNHGIGINASSRPVMVVAYRRLRFLDPMTGVRIALDQYIHASRHALSCPGPPGSPFLPFAVIETKGQLASLPRYLIPLMTMGLRPESFSKYLLCYQSLMQQHT
jgi:hypothetical protein